VKRVVQTRTGDDGNCLNACIASILELPLKAVPEFGEDWQGDLNDFLATKGLRYRRVPMHSRPSGWSTIEGVSPRGGLHACVALDGELAWDPHPIEDGTGQGLVEPRYYGLLEPLSGRAGDANQPLAEVRGIIRGWSFADATGVQRRLTKAEDFVRIADLSTRQKKAVEDLLRPLRSALEEMEADGQFPKKATDRADMRQLRAKTEQQGGPFFMQETTKSGAERTIPVRELAKGADAYDGPLIDTKAGRRNFLMPLAKGADSKTSEVVLLLLAIYAWYKSREKPPLPTYDLAKYAPKKRALDAPIDRWRMSDILDALGIDIKEYMRRTEPQKKALLKTALEKLSSK